MLVTDDSRDRSGNLAPSHRQLLQVIYDLLRNRGAWPTFRTVDVRFDRNMGIADAQAALATVPAAYLQRPWHAVGYYDNDEVRLTLRGVRECDGGPQDLDLLLRLMQWLCEVERQQDLAEETDPTVKADDFAAMVSLMVEPAHTGDEYEAPLDGGAADVSDLDQEDVGDRELPSESSKADENDEEVSPEIEQNRATLIRLHVLADLLLPHFWSGAGYPTDNRWRWQYTLDRRRLRPYRDINTVDELLDHNDRERQSLLGQRERLEVPRRTRRVESEDSAAAVDSESTIEQQYQEQPADVAEPAEAAPTSADEVSVLLTVLRPEVATAAAAQLRANMFDDAIFNAYRLVEAAVQKRTDLNGSIGDTLVTQAFKDGKNAIKVSDRAQDAERLIQLFGGALGLYKGDRSHKDKPTLPCRSVRKCLRQLAHASALLDLLDRHVAVAPAVRGYDQRGDILELWVDRASARSQVWLDDHLCQVIRHGPGSLALDVAGVPAGEHDLFIVDGTRTSPVTQVWLTRITGGADWQRVSEVSIPLFAAQSGAERLQATGLRLTVREHGIVSERIVPTVISYRVGDYVSPHFDPGKVSAATSSEISGTGPAWLGDGSDGPRQLLWADSSLFDGEPYGSAQEARLMKVALEPGTLLLRPGDKAPIRVLGHYTDGVASWAEPSIGCTITPDHEEIAYVKNGTVFAKAYGRTTLRLTRNGLYASATVHVASHPAGTVTDLITGLPPVAGIAFADGALIVSTRTDELWKLADGRYTIATAVPLQPPTYGGTGTMAAAANGDLALCLYGHRDLLVLDKASGYSKSRWIPPGDDASAMALTWDGTDLIIALHTGAIRRARPDGSSEEVTVLPGAPIVSIDRADDALLAITMDQISSRLWRVPLDHPSEAREIFKREEPPHISSVAWLDRASYLTEFHGGRLLRLEGTDLLEIVSGLHNPVGVALGPDQSIYISEFERGAVRRLLR